MFWAFIIFVLVNIWYYCGSGPYSIWFIIYSTCLLLLHEIDLNMCVFNQCKLHSPFYFSTVVRGTIAGRRWSVGLSWELWMSTLCVLYVRATWLMLRLLLNASIHVCVFLIVFKISLRHSAPILYCYKYIQYFSGSWWFLVIRVLNWHCNSFLSLQVMSSKTPGRAQHLSYLWNCHSSVTSAQLHLLWSHYAGHSL